MPRLRRRPDFTRGMAAGFLGGLVGAWAMNQYQGLESKIKDNCSGDSGREKSSEGSEDATMKAAAWVVESVAGIKLSHEQKKAAGPIVHYGFGAVMGAAYGAVMERRQRSSSAGGAMLGMSLLLGADELAVPALGLSKSPSETPLASHTSAMAAHLVYGVTTEAVRRRIRRALLLV